VMLYNNQNPYTVGMVVPDMEGLNRELKHRGIEKGTQEAHEAVASIIQNEINAYKKGGKFEGEFPERWLPATIAILPYAFSPDNKMLNAQMKMVRGQVTEAFAKELEFLYTPEAKNIVNNMNIAALEHWNK
jgi:long-chain acyl-CoA synthetase